MKRILDPCCGSRMFYFDKENPDVLFCDIRKFKDAQIWKSTNGKSERKCTVDPDVVCDFRHLPFEDNTFYHVVFDPPHFLKIGDKSWMAKKYGKLDKDWRCTIKQGFDECIRVLKPNGTLIFKWSEVDIPVSEIISVIERKPVYGHRSGKQSKTHWMCFLKDVERRKTP